MHAEMRILALIKDRLKGSKVQEYELCLMEEFPKSGIPETGKMYLKKIGGNKLEYVIPSANEEGMERRFLDVAIEEELTKSILGREETNIQDK